MNLFDFNLTSFPKKITRKVLGKVKSVKWKKRVLESHEIKELLFAQQHIFSKDYFKNRHGQYHTIKVAEFPHYQFLEKYNREEDRPNEYETYLKASWRYYRPQSNTEKMREARSQHFLKLFYDIKKRQKSGKKAIRTPILITKRCDGKNLILEGNHRAAIALALGLPLAVRELPIKDSLERIVQAPKEFFGTKHLNRPYQSIFYQGREIILGRRRDIEQRMRFISREDLTGRSVLDLGCNIGMSSYLAAEAGASRVLGLEINPNILTIAVRLNAFYGYRQVDFALQDLSATNYLVERFDTVFCFGLFSHMSSHKGIIECLKVASPKVLYFEGHANTDLSNYKSFLSAEIFSSVDCLGFGNDGIHTNTNTRPIFRCVLRRY